MKVINIFGAGPSGTVIARKYAEQGYKINLYEVRNHIAGNLYDFINDNGVLVHKYGPHIFQTSDEEVIKYVKKYSDWLEFRHKVNVIIGEKEVPLPINFKSIEVLFENSEEIKNALLKEFPNNEVIFIVDLIDSKDSVLKEFGNFVYKNVFENYTVKMWNISPEEIDPSVLKRVPIRLSYDDGYFSDAFQAVPKNGYTKFIENILNHENINVELSVPSDYLKIIDDKTYIGDKEVNDPIIYTGPIDKLFKNKYGSVPYRSLKFEFENKENWEQERPVVNYPSHPTMTRITDYKILSQQKEKLPKGITTIGKEYPGQYDPNSIDYNEPYYPINNTENNEIIKLYKNDAMKIKNLYLIGRLADYKYIQMAQAFKSAINFKLNENK